MVTVRENPKQKTVSRYLRPEVTREYTLFHTTSRLEASLALLNAVPPEEDAIDNEFNPIVLPLDDFSLDESGGGVWQARVRWAASTDTMELSFKFGAKSEKIFQGLEHIRTYSCVDGSTDDDEETYTGPYFNGAIGVNGDEVEGVDIEVSAIDFTISQKYKISSLESDYIQTIIGMFGERGRTPTNDAEWSFEWKNLTLTFPEQSVRFRGFDFKWTAFDELDVSYMFSYQRGIIGGEGGDDFAIGSSGAIEKKGWEYLWINYEIAVQGGRSTRTPIAVVIDKVYPTADFNLLDI